MPVTEAQESELLENLLISEPDPAALCKARGCAPSDSKKLLLLKILNIIIFLVEEEFEP